MEKEIIITDFSKMPEGICIFGYDQDYKGIRPVIFKTGEKEKGLPENYIRGIAPFMKVKFGLIEPQPNPPHTEDWLIDKDYQPKIMGHLLEIERKEFLEKTISYSSMKAADWGTEVHLYRNKGGPYINPNEGERSIITIKVKNVSFFEYSEKPKELEGYNYRIAFSDMIGDDVSVTDSAVRKYCDNLRNQGKSYGFIGAELQRKLNQGDTFFRIGAGRRYDPMEGDDKKCFLFVTGIYSFPDYKK